MTILITRTRRLELAGIALIAAMLVSFSVSAQEDVSASPHWTASGCVACHANATPAKGAVNLKAADAEALCETCHGSRGDALPCRHGSDIPAGSLAIAESLQSSLKDGNVVCTTCHDIVHQCERPKQYYSLENPGFLRDRTSRDAADYCYKCHKESAYSALNPHKGVAGNPPRATCPLCHTAVPESDRTGAIRASFNMEHDLNDTCRGCHEVRPHPRPIVIYTKQQEDEWVHLVAPSQEVLAQMRHAEQANGVVLPLSPEKGEVFCATCHDPHEFKGGPVAEQPEHRLRADNICQVCHEK
jgi:uncharacterized Zn finger protein (UPF0148 family)